MHRRAEGSEVSAGHLEAALFQRRGSSRGRGCSHQGNGKDKNAPGSRMWWEKGCRPMECTKSHWEPWKGLESEGGPPGIE